MEHVPGTTNAIGCPCRAMYTRRAESLRRGLRLISKFSAALFLLHWLCLVAAGSWAPFHAWLHGDSIPEGDSCPVAALQQGNLAATAVSSAAIVVLAGFLLVILASFTGFVPVSDLQDVRGPPASGTAPSTPSY